MDAATVQLILGLVPLLDRLIVNVGDSIGLDTGSMTRDEILAAIEESKSDNWPELEFTSPRK